MKLNHNIIENNNMIENYVLGKLNKEEESDFEEHILGCVKCRRKCELLETIIAGSEQRLIEEDDTLQTNKTKKITLPVSYKILWRAAAAIVILAGAVYFITNTGKFHPANPKNQQVADNYRTDTTNKGTNDSSAVSIDKIKNKESQQEEPGIEKYEQKKYTLLAEAFDPSPVFESAIQNQLRSNDIAVTSPADSAMYKKNQEIVFLWHTNSTMDIILILRKNTGNTIFKEKVQSPCSKTIDIPGLYYWQLAVHDEVIHTGKFLVK
ncbi:MAG: zf-HC2 domain-containing protein [Bacteroidales bacterium]|nr:zf-HC2 domain-containing protein [Bacteroidales bacterium]